MKKLAGFIRSNAKVLAAVTITAAVSSSSVYAATILLNANQVGFDKTGTSLSSTDVQGALNELHTRVSTWVDPSGAYMQDFDKSKLPNVNDSMTLTDRRDGNRYTVKRLADGNVWMTRNLRIGKSTSMTLTSADSDVESSYTIPASDISRFTGGSNNTAIEAFYMDDMYGGYYTHRVAVAGSPYVSASQPAAYSICPKGWKLPSKDDFSTLITYYNSLEAMQVEPNSALSGSVNNTSPPTLSTGNSIKYWTSTFQGGTTWAYLAIMESSQFRVHFFNSSVYGTPVRCIAR